MGANAQTAVPTFTASQILTAQQMNESARTGVPVFATTTTRDAAFGGAGEKTLAEGQLAYIEASDTVQYYDGSAWKTLAPLAFNTIANITATNASWPVPTLAYPIVKVTAIGAGGGGGGGNNGGTGGTGGNTTFNAGTAGTVTGTGGTGGVNGPPTGQTAGQAPTAGVASNNGGVTPGGNTYFGADGNGGQITVAYLNLTGISTVNVTIGAGGAGAGGSSTGGRGEVRVEYIA